MNIHYNINNKVIDFAERKLIRLIANRTGRYSIEELRYDSNLLGDDFKKALRALIDKGQITTSPLGLGGDNPTLEVKLAHIIDDPDA